LSKENRKLRKKRKRENITGTKEDQKDGVLQPDKGRVLAYSDENMQSKRVIALENKPKNPYRSKMGPMRGRP
jgi:hypothetical protein